MKEKAERKKVLRINVRVADYTVQVENGNTWTFTCDGRVLEKPSREMVELLWPRDVVERILSRKERVIVFKPKAKQAGDTSTLVFLDRKHIVSVTQTEVREHWTEVEVPVSYFVVDDNDAKVHPKHVVVVATDPEPAPKPSWWARFMGRVKP